MSKNYGREEGWEECPRQRERCGHRPFGRREHVRAWWSERPVLLGGETG